MSNSSKLLLGNNELHNPAIHKWNMLLANQ